MKTTTLLLAAWLAIISTAQAGTPGEVGVGGFLREAQLRALTGPDRALSSYRGKPMIINVWASWCAPCRLEMGSLDRLARRYRKQFTVIGISTDDYPDRAQAFLKQANTSFSHYIDSKLFLENMLGANRIPLTILVDRDGRVLGKYYGAKEWDSPQAINLIENMFQIDQQKSAEKPRNGNSRAP